ncbi:hypothetical protein Csa_016874 [Cucumis sativus]|nr:hypothetical protein Csa_016874 [Cucumis sativus]
MAIINFLAHIFLLLSLFFSLVIKAEHFSPWLKEKLNDDELDNEDNRYGKHNCSGKQIFCRKLDEYGSKGKRKKIMKCCKHRCVDTDSDIKNCGYCGKICPFPQQCCKAGPFPAAQRMVEATAIAQGSPLPATGK